MKNSTRVVVASAAGALLGVGMTINGLRSAAEGFSDYTMLPVDVSDSLAYSAAPFDIDPEGRPGVEAVYTPREGGTRQITTTILVLPDAQAAVAALAADPADMANTQSQPAAQGAGGTMLSGTSPDGTESVTVLTFTEGNTAATIEFDGPPSDPAPADFVMELGQKQDTAIKDWQSA
ncbi:hypothetical protein [Mycobacterium sp. URHB0021]